MTKVIEVEELVQDLDSTQGAINCRRITLDDISDTLAHLRVQMDNVKPNEIRFRFEEYHRTIRMLSDLMLHTMSRFNDEYKTLHEISECIFQKVLNPEKKPSLPAKDSESDK